MSGMKYQVLQVGTDTELFLKDAHGNPVTAIGRVGGTKAKPKPVMGGKGYAVQEDNVMVEFNIPPAAKAKQFSDSIGKMLSFLTDEMKQQGLFLDFAASRQFTPDQLAHPQAAHIGCEPDYCVWTQSENEIDKDAPILKTTRSCGGHIHVSFTFNEKKPSINTIEPLVAAMDIAIGVGLSVMDTDRVRKKLYGKAGAFRPKPYGLEYRVPSNFWVGNAAVREWVFKQTTFAANLATGWMTTKKGHDWRSNYVYVKKAIDESDNAHAEYVMNAYGIRLPR